jgi:hypothetical protein
MDADKHTGELLVEKAEENQTRKILELVRECTSVEEALDKIKALLKK